MKMVSSRGAVKALTKLELLVVVAVIALLVAMILPATRRARIGGRPPCVSNLRQIGITMAMFAGDNNGRFPTQIAVTNGGSMELIGIGNPALHFQTLSNYIQGYWGKFHCPADHSHQPATNRFVLTVSNVSYFLSMDATPEATNTILAGDRNLQLAGKPVKPGLFTLLAGADVGWTREMHFTPRGDPSGNLLFTDAHVEAYRTNLPAVIRLQGLPANRLAVP
jgi:hypothetical protein